MNTSDTTPQTPSQAISDAVARLFDSYPKGRGGANTPRLYAEHLSGYSPQAVTLAINYAIQHSKFFPTIANIVEAMGIAVAPDKDRRKRTCRHASMCLGMNEMEILRYFEAERMNTDDIDMDYFRNILDKDERERTAQLAKQWPYR